MSEIKTIRHGGYPEPIKKNKMREVRLHKHKHSGITSAEKRAQKWDLTFAINTQSGPVCE